LVAFHIRNRLTRASSRLTALCRLLRCVLSPHRPRNAAFYSNADGLSGHWFFCGGGPTGGVRSG
jgi:hypothetical protein